MRADGRSALKSMGVVAIEQKPSGRRVSRGHMVLSCQEEFSALLIPRGRFLPKVLLVGEVAGATELISEESTQEFWVGEGCTLVIHGGDQPTILKPNDVFARIISRAYGVAQGGGKFVQNARIEHKGANA